MGKSPLKANQPIGIFDSGIGGLTVANAVMGHLPKERVIYFGDTAHLPYGDKSAATIRTYSERITRFLLEHDCKLIVIACNSASSAAFSYLERKFGDQVHLTNVIDPVVEAVARRKKFSEVGIIGTKATIRSGAYKRKLRERRPDLKVHSQATLLLAQMIEEGFYNNNISKAVIRSYLEKKHFKNIEALVLACTHYPLVQDDIDAYYEGRVHIFDSMQIVAKSVAAKLRKHKLLADRRSGKHTFFVSDYTRSFKETTNIFMGTEVDLLEARISL